jgi:hypothetical protein
MIGRADTGNDGGKTAVVYVQAMPMQQHAAAAVRQQWDSLTSRR